MKTPISALLVLLVAGAAPVRPDAVPAIVDGRAGAALAAGPRDGTCPPWICNNSPLHGSQGAINP